VIGVSCSAMYAPRRRRRAIVLLLAVLAQPAWLGAHAALHEHLESHHEHPDVTAQTTLADGAHAHDHEHGHLDAVFVRPARSTDLSSPSALPSTMLCAAAFDPQRLHLHPETSSLLASSVAADPSDPRAPPIA